MRPSLGTGLGKTAEADYIIWLITSSVISLSCVPTEFLMTGFTGFQILKTNDVCKSK